MPAAPGADESGRARCLDTDYPHIGAALSERCRDTRDQPAAANADQHGTQPRYLLDQLEPDRALTGDHYRVVEGVYEQPTEVVRGGLGGKQGGVDVA